MFFFGRETIVKQGDAGAEEVLDGIGIVELAFDICHDYLFWQDVTPDFLYDINGPCQVPSMVASLEMPLAAVVGSVGDFVTLALLRCNFWQEYFHQTIYTEISKYGIFAAMPCLGQLSLQKCIYDNEQYLIFHHVVSP